MYRAASRRVPVRRWPPSPGRRIASTPSARRSRRSPSRRCRRVDFTSIELARIVHAVSDHTCRRRPVVPHEPVEVRHMDQRDVAAVGDRVHTVDCVGPGRIVFHIHGGNVDARTAAYPPLRQFQFLRPLQHHDVEVVIPQVLGRDLGRPGPMPSAPHSRDRRVHASPGRNRHVGPPRRRQSRHRARARRALFATARRRACTRNYPVRYHPNTNAWILCAASPVNVCNSRQRFSES